MKQKRITQTRNVLSTRDAYHWIEHKKLSYNYIWCNDCVACFICMRMITDLWIQLLVCHIESRIIRRVVKYSESTNSMATFEKELSETTSLVHYYTHNMLGKKILLT